MSFLTGRESGVLHGENYGIDPVMKYRQRT